MPDYRLGFLLENNMRGRPSSCMSNHHVKRGERKIVYEDMNNLHGWSMSQYLPKKVFFTKLKLQRKLKEI